MSDESEGISAPDPARSGSAANSADGAEGFPDILGEGWLATRDPRELCAVKELQAAVSTNRVYRLSLSDGSHVVAKVSSYGSFVHFRQDHERIHRWIEMLRGTPYRGFLADVVCRGGEVFVYREGPSWLALYEEVPIRESLPRVLSELQIENLGVELARFHRECQRLAPQLRPTWKSLGSDLAQLRDQLEQPAWCEPRGIGAVSAEFLREHCDAFLTNADGLDYHAWTKIPVLVDWNIGNFSIEPQDAGFRLFSRWDYDWFRIEPRALDFYFLARVVSAIGDRTQFSYGAGPLLEPRFRRFLRSYHTIHPLRPEELLFLKEAYRFFLLNYVIRDGEHFFRPELCAKLRREVIELHLPSLFDADFSELLSVLE